jgi:NodT family efflux transporter outer membrane factor (OMF) lipoprotein
MEGGEAGAHAVWVGLLAEIGSNYLELRGLQQRLQISREQIELQRQRLQVVEALFRAGLSNQWDISRQTAQLHGAEARLPSLERATAMLVHRLGVLVGVTPESLEARLQAPMPIPTAMPQLPMLTPASLLEQRPDLRLAKSQVMAEAAQLGSARADLLPKVQLNASAGLGSLAVGGFPSLAETVYALGAGLSAPLFNAGRIRAHIAAQDARLEQAAANYEKVFLTALEDVENAYVSQRTAREMRDQLQQAETAAYQSVQHAHAYFETGAADRLSVLDAQKGRLEIQDERTKAETAVAVAVVSLYRAFGGGWSQERTD